MSFLKRIAALVVLCLVLSLSFISASAAIILEEKEEKTLVKGVTYTHFERLYDYGWQDIHVIKADLSEEHLAFDILKSANGNSFLEDTFTSAKVNDTLAAINGDFFAAKKGQTGRGSAVGIEIIDGVLRTTPASDEKMHALYRTEEGDFYFNEFTYDITITAPNGNTEKIRHINKYDDLNGIVLYNENWNGLSLGATFGIIEVVVDENNIVLEKRRFADPVEIPENGYILSSDLDVFTFLDDNFEVGDEVKIDIKTTPNYEVINDAVGGGGMLVVDGVAQTSFSHDIKGANPRTAVGLDESGKIMYFVVLDGRRDFAKGMTQTQLGELMKEIGCFNAMNLDGGGSSLLAIKEDGEQKVANEVSYKRPVTNSLGISSDAKVGETKKIVLETDDTNMFLNTSRLVTIYGLDEYSHKTEINLEDVKWTISGASGEIVDGMVTADEIGEITVLADYKGIKSEIKLNVIGELCFLEFDEPKMALKSGESKILSITGRNAKGYPAKVYAKDTDISAEDCGKVEGNLFTAGKISGLISAGFGKVKAYAQVSVDGKDAPSVPEIKWEDKLNVKTEKADNGFVFNVFGNTRTPKKMFDLYIMNNVVNVMKEQSDLSSFVGSDVDSELLTELDENTFLANGYSSFSYSGSNFICIENTSGTLAGNDISQWTKFKEDVKKANGNLFVLLNKISVSSNDIEYKNFEKILSDAAERGVNVFVIGGGWKNKSELKSGVRYIQTAGVFPSIGLKAPATDISYVKYLRIAVNGDEVTYSFENIFNKR